ncbi:MAG: tagaturonate epimerase family protein, partial [Trueperaceae bacterium]|nr:tagaturonate epimerase family protein [Trueperaceae bacterium]
TRGLVHLKTAGTSYLEALRVAAVVDPALFREVLALGLERFATDKASYLIGARAEAVPRPEALRDADLPALLDQDDARQVLHVTFGSALDAFGQRLHDLLRAHREAHVKGLAHHFERHLRPFVAHARAAAPDPR